MFFCEWRRAYPRMQGAIHGKTAQKNNADCLEFFQLSTRTLLLARISNYLHPDARPTGRANERQWPLEKSNETPPFANTHAAYIVRLFFKPYPSQQFKSESPSSKYMPSVRDLMLVNGSRVVCLHTRRHSRICHILRDLPGWLPSTACRIS